MAFKNKLKLKKLKRFFLLKKNFLINPTRYFINFKHQTKLEHYFANQMNSLRRFKIAFSVPKTSILKLYSKGLKNSSKKIFILKYLSVLESRLDNVLYNTGIFLSRYSIKQIIFHKNIYINKKLVFNKSYALKKGDIITFKPKIFNQLRCNLKKSKTFFLISSYFEINYNIFTIIILYTKLNILDVLKLSNKFSNVDFKYFHFIE